MVSFADNIANGIGRISGGFDNAIMGQAIYINKLQQGGAGAGALGQLGANPAASVKALGQNPALLGKLLQTLKDNPQMVQALPPQVKQFLSQLIQGQGQGQSAQSQGAQTQGVQGNSACGCGG